MAVWSGHYVNTGILVPLGMLSDCEAGLVNFVGGWCFPVPDG